MHKKIKVLIILTLAIAFLGAGCSKLSENQNSKEEEENIKVGFVSALSGNAAEWGKPLKKGFKFGIKQINKNGGIEGRKIKPIYKDSGCKSKQGLSAFRNLINVQKVNFITGTVCSSVAITTAPLINKNNIFYLASGATHPKITNKGESIFRLWVSDGYEAKEIADYAIDKLNNKTFSIGHFNDNPAGVALKNNFKKEIRKNNGKVLSVQSFSSQEKSFRSILTKLISENPDSLYLVTTPSQTPLIVNTARELGFEGNILLYGSSAKSDSSEKIKNKEDIFYAIPDPKKQTEFWEKYKKQKGKEASQLNALGYDSAQMIADGIKKCGKDIKCMRNYFTSKKKYKTTRGTFEFNKYGDITDINFEIKEL